MFVVRLRNRIGLKYEMLKCLPTVQYSDFTNVCRQERQNKVGALLQNITSSTIFRLYPNNLDFNNVCSEIE
jgi:hypothetical protein